MSRADAAREVRLAVEATGLTRKDFAAKAQVDLGTLADFISGARWPQAPTRKKIENALRWPAGRIAELEEADLSTMPADSSIEDAIHRAEDLLPEAKEHLLRQVALLRRVQAADATQAAETEKRLARLREGRRAKRGQRP